MFLILASLFFFLCYLCLLLEFYSCSVFKIPQYFYFAFYSQFYIALHDESTVEFLNGNSEDFGYTVRFIFNSHSPKSISETVVLVVLSTLAIPTPDRTIVPWDGGIACELILKAERLIPFEVTRMYLDKQVPGMLVGNFKHHNRSAFSKERSCISCISLSLGGTMKATLITTSLVVCHFNC